MIKNAIYFDTESYNEENNHFNPFEFNNKLLSIQIGWFNDTRDYSHKGYVIGDLMFEGIVYTTLKISGDYIDNMKIIYCDKEHDMIINFLNLLNKKAITNGERNYSSLVTYNGLFDLLYIIFRLYKLNDNRDNILDEQLEYTYELFTRLLKHCDMMQFDNGSFIKQVHLVVDNNIIPNYPEINGSKIKQLYDDGKYFEILLHGIDDIRCLSALDEHTKFGERFSNIKTLNKSRNELDLILGEYIK